ncbi:MAG TPA: hypothetical protein VKA17_00085 [Gammaproteobacteria bacterium]|nr:hypothetical protein [Gammaproteobacteria bacterium]
MSMDSGDEHAAAGCSPQTMDSWAWIGRARAAARRAAEAARATESADAAADTTRADTRNAADAREASDPEDSPGGGPGRRTPPAG